MNCWAAATSKSGGEPPAAPIAPLICTGAEPLGPAMSGIVNCVAPADAPTPIPVATVASDDPTAPGSKAASVTKS